MRDSAQIKNKFKTSLIVGCCGCGGGVVVVLVPLKEEKLKEHKMSGGCDVPYFYFYFK